MNFNLIREISEYADILNNYENQLVHELIKLINLSENKYPRNFLIFIDSHSRIVDQFKNYDDHDQELNKLKKSSIIAIINFTVILSQHVNGEENSENTI